MELTDTQSSRPTKRQKISASDISLGKKSLPQCDGSTDIAPQAELCSSTPNIGFTSDDEFEREARAGISAFVCPDLPGFEGVLKRRYTDFLVNEILPNGQVLHLEDLMPPKIQRVQETKESEQYQKDFIEANNGSSAGEQDRLPRAVASSLSEACQANSKTKPLVDLSIESDRAFLHTIFTAETLNAIEALYERIINNPQRKPSSFWPVKTEEIPDKEMRTRAHRAFRNIFQSRLESQTAADDKIIVTIAPVRNKGRGGEINSQNSMQRGSLSWADLGGQWLHFTIFKENKDTMEVVHFLASQAKMNVKQFQFGGTKDRRAVTVQRASAYRLRAEKLASVGQQLRQAKIGDFKYETAGLELGDLAGNEFAITLRECRFPNQEGIAIEEYLERARIYLSEVIEQFKDRGFLNYYGLQRFGSFSTGTDVVGTKLLQGDLRGAVDSILSFNPSHLTPIDENNSTTRIASDDRNRAEAINIWNTTGDSTEALQKLPRKFSAESNIIRHLGTRDRHTGALKTNDFQGALSSIARNLRLMYVHAYQSLVWNTIASKRWKMYGNLVVAGDLILVHEHKDKEPKNSPEPEVDDEGEFILRPAGNDGAADPVGFTRARALSKEEAQSGLYSIFDVVLPLPGFDVLYPQNAAGEEYKTFMASKQGGGLDPYDMRRQWKDLSLSGGYRKLLARPAPNMSFEFKLYNDDNEQLVETDLDRLKKQAELESNGKGTLRSLSETENSSGGQLVQNGSETAFKKLAVVLKMQLGSSQYATMALRELMKSGLKIYKPDFSGGR